MGDTRLEKLKELEETLYATMQECEPRELAAIARQYRETIREIEEIEGAESNEDEIAEILQKRDSDGKAGAVRKNSTKI
jgi:phytoene/squalene synthetase